MVWSLFDEKGQELKAKVFSNGKSQEDVVNEVVNEIKKGMKIIFIHGVCGSGKSAIALNIAKEIGRASVVVPIKNLQRQYQNDYMNKKFVLKNNGEKLRISMITGRKNHVCPYLEENKKEILLTRVKEKNSNLFDIFEGARKSINNIENDVSCDNLFIPCKIEIKSKNISTLKKYYSENPERKAGADSELDLKTMKRFAVAPACPYWLPILNENMKVKLECEKKKYKSIAGEHVIYIRKNGCPYYNQFLAYADSDVIIFNSDSYLLETALGRKPLTDVEIIDECDEFLDNFALEGTINLSKLRNELNGILTNESSERKLVESLGEDVIDILDEAREFLDKEENVTEVNRTKVALLIKALVKSDVFEIMSDESYLEHCVEIARKFYDILDYSYVNFAKDRKAENRDKADIYVKIITINLEKLLDSLIEKNRAFVFMSGTLHSERVLREVFGLKDFKIVEAEIFNQGTIAKIRTGLEKDFKFDNFEKKRVTRENYLRALNKCVVVSKIPTVVHVSAFQDLPSEEEKVKYDFKELISSQELFEQQKNDKEGRIVKDFKAGKMPFLFTTRCNRGIDFPFEMCNSVVITKFPYPNTQSLFWRILKKNKPEIFWDFYKDKAHRELLQRIYRSVRDPKDHVFLLSPDIRVLESKIIEKGNGNKFEQNV
jgi:Rad3-related DNA helicase